MSRPLRYSLAISVFLILAVLDFVPIQIPARMIFPLLWLSLCAFCLKQWALTAALFFSFLGDVMGWKNELIPQIAFFALAQILYIIIFSRLMPPKNTWSLPLKIVLLALVSLVYGAAMYWIFPRVEDSFIACGSPTTQECLPDLRSHTFCHIRFHFGYQPVRPTYSTCWPKYHDSLLFGAIATLYRLTKAL